MQKPPHRILNPPQWFHSVRTYPWSTALQTTGFADATCFGEAEEPEERRDRQQTRGGGGDHERPKYRVGGGGISNGHLVGEHPRVLPRSPPPQHGDGGQRRGRAGGNVATSIEKEEGENPRDSREGEKGNSPRRREATKQAGCVVGQDEHTADGDDAGDEARPQGTLRK